MNADEIEFEDTRWARFLIAVFGEDRLKRFILWAERKAEPCPYVDPYGHSCKDTVGHPGSCWTVGKYDQDRFWYGINYDHETGAYLWRKAKKSPAHVDGVWSE